MEEKEKTIHASEQEREDVAAARTVWRAEQASQSCGDLIFLDESGVDTAMTRRYARAPHGARAVGSAPGHWKRLTVLGALGREGLVAAMTVPRATTGLIFLAFVEQVLIPALKSRPHSVVVLDNLSAHKNPKALAAFQDAKIEVRFLPPYSPDLNPIEPCWSKVKTALRRAAARTLDAIDDALPRILDSVTPDDCKGWFRHCGYSTL